MFARVLSAFFFCSCLAACAHSGAVKVVPVPAELTAPVPEPQLEGDTNADLVTWIDRLRSALGLANTRLESIGNIKPE
jgi:hypothetical protein